MALKPATWLIVLFGLWLAAFAGPLRAGEGEPVLQLDTGGHMALVRALLFTADGKRLISAGDDKVVRVWDVTAGRTERTIRGEIGDGEAGKIYAVALSPDQRLLAVGGHTAMAGGEDFPVRLYDFETGALVALLRGHKAGVLSLDFSPDGRLLASGGVDDTAIVWDVARRSAVARLVGHGGDVNAVRFARDGQSVVTASDDGELGLWRAQDGRRMARMKGHEGIVVAIAISPADGTIASGALDHGIRLWDGRNGAFLRRLADTESPVMGLAFSPDGRWLLSSFGARPYSASLWDVASGRRIGGYDGHDNIALPAAISPDGRIAATAGGDNNEIHLWEPISGRLVARLRGSGQAVWAVGFSAEGDRIAWGSRKETASLNDQGPLLFALRLPGEATATGEPRPLEEGAGEFRRAVESLGDLGLSHRASGQSNYFDLVDIIRAGQTIATIQRGESDGYAHNAYSLGADGETVYAGGGNGFLSAYGLDALKRLDFAGHTGDVWAIAVSPDGDLLLSGSDDQTLKLWNAATGETIVSLFHGQDGEWVMWTPQGYYAASPAGDVHVGWHVNQGEDKAAKFVTAAQLKQRFYRPDVIRQALLARSARRAAETAGNEDFSIADLAGRRPPEVTVTVTGQEAGSARLTIAVEDSGAPAETLDLVVNGRLIRAGSLSDLATSEGKYLIEVALSPGENRIRLAVANAIGRSVRELALTGTGEAAAVDKGTLYLLSIGVDDYPNFKQNLEFAGADAREFQKLMIDKAGGLHSEVRTLLLTKDGSEAPTAVAILAALAEFERAGPDDTVVIFMAGHGINDGADYLFLPTDAKHEDGKWVEGTVVSWKRLQEVMEHTRGRRIMLVDTCHAGNAFNPRLIKDTADASIAVLAATDAETLAQERSDLGHGVFTSAVLEGMRGKADTTADRLIHVKELSTYVAEAVRSITRGKQLPAAYVADHTDFVFSSL